MKRPNHRRAAPVASAQIIEGTCRTWGNAAIRCGVSSNRSGAGRCAQSMKNARSGRSVPGESASDWTAVRVGTSGTGVNFGCTALDCASHHSRKQVPVKSNRPPGHQDTIGPGQAHALSRPNGLRTLGALHWRQRPAGVPPRAEEPSDRMLRAKIVGRGPASSRGTQVRTRTGRSKIEPRTRARTQHPCPGLSLARTWRLEHCRTTKH